MEEKILPAKGRRRVDLIDGLKGGKKKKKNFPDSI